MIIADNHLGALRPYFVSNVHLLVLLLISILLPTAPHSARTFDICVEDTFINNLLNKIRIPCVCIS